MLRMRYATVVLAALAIGCASDETGVRDGEQLEPAPLVIDPIRTDITGSPAAAGGIDESELPVLDVQRRSGQIIVEETTAGEPVIVTPEERSLRRPILIVPD